MTRDLDIVVDVRPEDAGRLVETFDPEFHVPRAMVEMAVRERGLFNIIHERLAIKVDLHVMKDEEYADVALTRRRPVDVDGERVFVASPEDLLLAKLRWARGISEIQRRDARNLIAHQRISTGPLSSVGQRS